MKKLVFLLLCLLLALSLFGCDMLKGDSGAAGADGAVGKSSYDIAVENGFTGTVEEWLNSLKGSDGIGIAGISIDHDGYVYITLTNGEKYTIMVEDYCYHENTTKIVTSPTCTNRGYTTETCNDCGFVITNNYVEMIGHHFVDKKCNTCGADEKFGYITVNTEWYTTNNSTFTISTREQLAGLSYLVSEGNNFSGKTITLGCDIDLGGDEWIPIGNAKTQFAGTFDGHEYTIYNLKISEQNEYVGLFGYVTGTVKRLNITAASVTSNRAGSCVAIACGYCTGNLEMISTAGFLTAPDATYVGGVVGKIVFSGTKTLTELKNSATVVGRDYTGGVFGYINSEFDYNSSHTLNFSFNENSGDVTGAIYIGGIAGRLLIDNYNSGDYIKLSATDLINTGNITGREQVGGLFGLATADVASSISNSKSSANVSGDYYVGGLAGQLGNITLDACDNTGSTVTANDYMTSNGVYYVYLGGYVGYGYELVNCVNTVNITYTSKGDYVGGLAGYLTHRASACENHANVTAEDSNYVGGLAGTMSFAYDNTIENCKNSGSITGLAYVGGLYGKIHAYFDINNTYTLNLLRSDNSGVIVGETYVGGLCGELYLNNVNSGDHIKLTSTDISNTGNVTGQSYVGGLFGQATSDMASSVTSATSSANIVGDYYVGGLAGYLGNISLIDCSNAGSTVTAEDYQTVSGDYYAYVGGYVGFGYEVVNSVNASDITYTSKGNYVGGIAGYLTYRADACENSGNITAESANYVGGLVGQIGFSGGNDIKNCKNSGTITGNNYVGGLFGSLRGYFDINTTYICYLSLSENSGEIIGNDYTGGLAGDLYLNNTNSGDNIGLTASDISNSGNVTGNSNVGGLFGSGWTDNGGTIKDYSNTGVVTGVENTNDIIGVNTNISY